MSGQHQKDVAYSPLEKHRLDYRPRTAHEGRTNWCIGGLCLAVAGLLVWVIYITLVINKVEIRPEKNKVEAETRDNMTSFQHKGYLDDGMTQKDKEDIKVLERIIADLTEKTAKSELNGIDDDRLRRNLDNQHKNTICMTEASQVTNFDQNVSDLVFDPEVNAWFVPKDHQKYFTLFAEDSRPLIEYERSNGKKSIKRDRKKSKTQIDIERNKNRDGNPEFILSLRQDMDCLNLFAASGNRIFATSDSLIAIENVKDEDKKTPVKAGEKSHCWKLQKCDEIFYLIESVKFSGRFWRTSQGNGIILDSVPELFTGINTNFIIGYELKQGDDPKKAPEGIQRERYGDILVKYIDPKGFQKDGWICDNDWTYKNAEVFCRSKWPDHTGIPSYNGRYVGNDHNIEYAISGMKCSSADTFLECKFKTECSYKGKCKAQRSMRLYDGRGFGCNRGSNSDIAGVICGTKPEIDKIKNKNLEESCKQNQLAADTRTAAKMASIQQQATEVSQMMFTDRHWSEYLIPLPMTVSMISMLMLISAQYEGAVRIPKGHQNQKWEVLKFDILTPNLYKLNDLVIDSFEYSTHAMQKININSVDMNEELEKSIKYSASTGKLAQKKLKRALRNIEEMATTNVKEATETISRFDEADKYISELIQAMKLTQSVSEDDKKKLELLQNVTETKRIKLEEKQEEEIKQYAILKEKEKNARTALYETAQKARTASCLMDEQCSSRGSRPCNSCQYKEAYIRKGPNNTPMCIESIDKCVEEKRTCKTFSERCLKKVMECIEHDHVCLNPKQVCEKKGPATCKEYKSQCKRKQSYSRKKGSLCKGECGDNSCGPVWDNPCCKTSEDGWEECEKDGKCVEYEDKCETYWDQPCEKWVEACPGNKTEVCVKKEEKCKDTTDYCTEYETVCAKNETVCTKYDMVSEGTFCMDQNSLKPGACCSGCAGQEAIEETLKAVLDTSVRLATKSFEDDSNIDIVEEIITADLDILQSLKRTVDSTATLETAKSDTIDESTTKKRGKRSVDSTATPETKETVMSDTIDETKTKNGEKRISIEVDIERLKMGIPLHISQLSIIAMRNPLAAQSKAIIGEIQEVIENIPENEIKDVQILNENDKKKITKLKSQLEAMSKIVSKAVEQVSVDVNKSGFKTSIDIAEKAETYLSSQFLVMKTARKTEILSSSLESALESLASQKIEVNDYKKTIKFLIRCSKHLTKLKEAWGDIKYFFGTLETFLEKVKRSARAIKEEFSDIMEYTGAKKSGPISDDLRKTTVRATAFNIYTKKLSSFYVGIMENGLLRKIRGLNFDRLTPEKAESYKTYILNECKAEMKRISNEVSKEQADLNDEITEKMVSIKNKLACALKESNLPDKFMEYENLEDKSNKLEQIKEVVSNKDGKGLDEKTLQDTGILNDSPVKSLDEYGKASGKNEDDELEEEDEYDEYDELDTWLNDDY